MKYIRFLSLILLINQINGIAKDYKGGELRTNEDYTYGRFEVSYKASAGSGQTSTFFTYHDFTSGGTGNWNEIDIEILGRYSNDVQFNTITPRQVNHIHHQWVDFSPYFDFHTYAIEWTPDYVAWFIDDDEVYRQIGEHISTLSKPQKIMMNIWNPVYINWVGEWYDEMLPFFAYYDWVSYSSYTPGEGNSGTDSNFTFQWKDDFDFWDQSRWSKATHTFSGNNCDFLPDNVVFKDGLMILCLTDNINTGYTDRMPPRILWARAFEDSVLVCFTEEVEKISAENISNYTVQNIDILSASLLSNNRAVLLKVSGIESNNSYNLIALRIKDRWQPPNTLMGQSVNIVMPLPLNFPIKINVGGNTYNEYIADQEWSKDVEYGFLDGNQNTWYNQQIDGTDKDQIYRDERRGLVYYKVRVPNGLYRITLMMAENYFDSSGKRIFDINLEGGYIARNFDIYREAGKNSAYNLIINSVSVTDRVIDIHFSAIKDFSLLNGLVIESVGTNSSQNFNHSPAKFYLSQNYPNPFNLSTSISYGLPECSAVSIEVYDILGRKIKTVVNERKEAGNHQVYFDLQMPTGVYFYKLEAISPNYSLGKIEKMLLMR